MKRVILSGLTVLLLSTTTATMVKAASEANSSVAQPGVTLAQSQGKAIKTGQFVKGEAPTTGTARIVNENGQRFLELDAGFQTSNQGPDLHVLLETSSKPPQSYKNFSSYVNLGKLQKFKGAQRYPIPAAINVSNFNSVVIWCRMANATFGYAALK